MTINSRGVGTPSVMGHAAENKAGSKAGSKAPLLKKAKLPDFITDYGYKKPFKNADGVTVYITKKPISPEDFYNLGVQLIEDDEYQAAFFAIDFAGSNYPSQDYTLNRYKLAADILKNALAGGYAKAGEYLEKIKPVIARLEEEDNLERKSALIHNLYSKHGLSESKAVFSLVDVVIQRENEEKRLIHLKQSAAKLPSVEGEQKINPESKISLKIGVLQAELACKEAEVKTVEEEFNSVRTECKKDKVDLETRIATTDKEWKTHFQTIQHKLDEVVKVNDQYKKFLVQVQQLRANAKKEEAKKVAKVQEKYQTLQTNIESLTSKLSKQQLFLEKFSKEQAKRAVLLHRMIQESQALIENLMKLEAEYQRAIAQESAKKISEQAAIAREEAGIFASSAALIRAEGPDVIVVGDPGPRGRSYTA